MDIAFSVVKNNEDSIHNIQHMQEPLIRAILLKEMHAALDTGFNCAVKLSSSPNTKWYASITEMSQSVMHEVHDRPHCVVKATVFCYRVWTREI